MRGDRVRALREARNWTRQDLVDKLQVSLNGIYRWENSERGVSEENLIKLVEILETSASYLNKHTKKRGEHSLRPRSPIIYNMWLFRSGGPSGHRTPACVFSLEPPLAYFDTVLVYALVYTRHSGYVIIRPYSYDVVPPKTPRVVYHIFQTMPTPATPSILLLVVYPIPAKNPMPGNLALRSSFCHWALSSSCALLISANSSLTISFSWASFWSLSSSAFI